MKRTLTQMLFIAACAAAWAMALAACGGGGATSGSASQTVQSYLQARVQGELDKMINLSCAEWEAQARVEATSFKSMKATLDGVSCKDAGTDGKFTLVSCQGKILTSYNGESREWSVAEHQFKVVQDRGEWRMCGYQ
jgi:hypothetical protein